MGKNYLNAQEKGDMLKIIALSVELENIIGSWAPLNGRKSLLKNIRTAKTYLEKVFKERTSDLDNDELGILLKQAKTQEIMFKPRNEVLREHKRLQKMADTHVLSWEDFSTLTGHALASCSICESIGDDVIECKFRKLLMEQDVQALNLEPKDGACQYRTGGN